MGKIEELKECLKYTLSYLLNIPLVHPKEVNFQMTTRCPLRCIMCNIPRLPIRGREMSVEETKRLIDQVAEWGPKYISFVGGEALVRKEDTIELIKYASSKGLHTTIVSNAHFLDEKTCEKLLDAGLSRLALSLDGATKETHDYIRGEGNYEKVMKAMRYMLKLRNEKKSKIKLDFTSVIMSCNFREMVDIYWLAKRMGVDQVFYQALVLDNTFQTFNFDSELWIKGKDLEDLKYVIWKLVKLKKEDPSFIANSVEYLLSIPKYFREKEKFRPGICLAGYMNLNIDPYGNINICGIGPNLNVIGKDLRKIWKSKEYKRTRILIKKCKRPCLMLCWQKIGLRGLMEILLR